MAWTQTDIDSLKAAIADGRGAKTITIGDQTVTFHSIDEMLKLLSVMCADVMASAGTSQRTRFAAVSKGV